MGGKPGLIGNMCVSGIIATVIAMACLWLMSLALPFPWTRSQTMIATAVACFCGSAVSFWQGSRGGRSAS